MANIPPHQAFPSRPYTAGLSRGGVVGGLAGQNTYQATPYNAQPTFNAPQQTAGGFGNAGATVATAQQREAQRLQREQKERAEREQQEAEERQALEQLSEEQREEVNEAVGRSFICAFPPDLLTSVEQFALFDLDKDSYIDYHELKVALKALGFDIPKTELLHLLQTHGTPASSLQQAGPSAPLPQQPTFSGPSRLLLSHASFVSIAAQKIIARDPRDEILRAFDLFDQDNKGRIDLQDLRRVARELGEGLQEEELAAMIEEFDIRGEGGINRDEFVGICLGDR